jgi:hypothetical protein
MLAAHNEKLSRSGAWRRDRLKRVVSNSFQFVQVKYGTDPNPPSYYPDVIF